MYSLRVVLRHTAQQCDEKYVSLGRVGLLALVSRAGLELYLWILTALSENVELD